MRYFIFQNANQVTAVSDDQLPAEARGDVAAGEQAALTIANGRFATSSGFDAAATFRLDIYDPETDAADQLPVPDGTMVRLAKDLHGGENLDFDDDAEISGLNVQCWRYVDPEEALEYLATGEPMAAERGAPDRREAAQAQYKALRRLVDDLLTEFDGPELADAKASPRVAELIGQLRDQPPADDRENVVLSRPMRSWEIGEGSDADLGDDQRRPWRLEVEQQGVQFRLSIFPEGADYHADEGIGLFIEINKGRPAVHVAPSPNADTVLHLHSLGGGTVEVVPAGEPPAMAESSVYSGAALRYELAH